MIKGPMIVMRVLLMKNFSTSKDAMKQIGNKSETSRSCLGKNTFQPSDRQSYSSIDRHQSFNIDRHQPYNIDRHPSKTKTHCKRKDKSDNQYLIPDEFGIFRDPDGYAKVLDGHTLHVSREDIADIHMQQRTITEHQQRVTKEFYDTAGGIDKSFKQGLDILLNHRSTLTSQHR
ncbi:hypothetical protein F2Q69_00052514 [Brassica cretica]|uniref:Uncharacterized protein n=1 Tax=Brassica cretica TaxID=69181 RepID=A0A8S9N4H3_BRACR|nr:hypothetical protein F2Q69_00052514 [Brassica cretica]